MSSFHIDFKYDRKKISVVFHTSLKTKVSDKSIGLNFNTLHVLVI